MRSFVDIDLGREPASDETTICKFRHLIEANGLGEMLKGCAIPNIIKCNKDEPVL
ncbi:MAG: hypothetical protein EXR05_05775 [Acetobacteraceae bacterium]|nr:hypothetical protein [Acetobacteraceae bacterium]MSP29536.1 hypothetical protein [Acetobacteraceae bacterium]